MSSAQFDAACNRIWKAAAALALQVRADLVTYAEAESWIEASAYTAPDVAELTTEEQFRVACYGLNCLTEAIQGPDIAAADAIKVAIGPLLAARNPVDAVLLAAFRAADGRLPTVDVENIVREAIRAITPRSVTHGPGAGRRSAR